PLALRCSREQNALHTLIRQRHLTPLCGGRAPTAERTVSPARIVVESLTPTPGIREQYRPISAAENDFAIVRAIVRVVPLRAVNKRLRARSISQSNHRCEALGRVVESAAYLNDVAVDRDDSLPASRWV